MGRTGDRDPSSTHAAGALDDHQRGEGSEGRLHFPGSEPLLESAARAPLPTLARGKETILVVEDEPLVRTLARSILERQGYSVVACANGAEALGVLEDQAAGIDLLLTDLVMPGMSGRELAERVVESRPKVQVLFTSGHSEDADSYGSVADRRAFFLAKPYSVHELSSRVREVLDAARG